MQEAADRKEQTLLEAANIARETTIQSEREDALTAAQIIRETDKINYEKLFNEQGEMFSQINNNTIAYNKAARKDKLLKENFKESKIKLFGDMLKNILSRMPDDVSDVPIYLDSVDRIFLEYSVPKEIKVHLLNPFFIEGGTQTICHVAP